MITMSMSRLLEKSLCCSYHAICLRKPQLFIVFSRFYDFNHSELLILTILFSGISSVVRRCIDKESGKEYAAKIIDIGAADANDPHQMLEATRQEIHILRQVMGHPYISEFT
jgi:hypothetical protein